MRQININVTPEFQRDLDMLMRKRKLKNKSDAIRFAVRQAAGARAEEPYDYRAWIGYALRAPLARKKKYLTEDELWS
jgi:Arc/MetJ-type ribon-helix-helix transcriptional regulator